MSPFHPTKLLNQLQDPLVRNQFVQNSYCCLHFHLVMEISLGYFKFNYFQKVYYYWCYFQAAVKPMLQKMLLQSLDLVCWQIQMYLKQLICSVLLFPLNYYYYYLDSHYCYYDYLTQQQQQLQPFISYHYYHLDHIALQLQGYSLQEQLYF